MIISGASILIAAIIYVARLVSRLTERVAHIEGMLEVTVKGGRGGPTPPRRE